MNLKLQKRLAAKLLKASKKRVKLDPSALHDVKEAITKRDVRELISDKLVKVVKKKGVSRARANKLQRQKAKGLRKGAGSRKGSFKTRLPKKEAWMNKVRIQREFLKTLKEKGVLETRNYRKLYNMVKGGFFRSKRHLKLYIEENELAKGGAE